MAECDSENVTRAMAGERRAYEALVIKYEKKIFNLAYRMTNCYEDAMDITQSTFIKAYQKLDSFDSSARFFSWIYRIATNESLNLIKKKSRTVAAEDLFPTGLEGGLFTRELNPEEKAIQNETTRNIQKILMQLKDDFKIVLILKHFVGLSYQEIGEVLDIPSKTVKSRLYSARQQAKEMILTAG